MTKYSKKDAEPEVEPEVEAEPESTLTQEGPVMLDIRLTDKGQQQGWIQYDSETGNQWQGNNIINTRLTAFVSERLGKTLQEATAAEVRKSKK